MERKNTGYIIAIIALVVAVVGMSIGFALSDINITISGADVTTKATSWDVHIKQVTGQISTGTPTVTIAAKKTDDLTATYAVELNAAGDAYEFDVEVINAGDYKAKLKSIAIEPLSSAYLKHTVTYKSTTYEAALNTISSATVLDKDDTETIHVKVAYVDPTATGDVLPTSTETATFKVTLTYTPAE